MHQYLRAIGFSNVTKTEELRRILDKVVSSPSFINRANYSKDMAEYFKSFSPSTGITIRGEYDQNKGLTLDFYYPYIFSELVSTTESISIERHAMQESYAGVCEDSRVGVTIIFFVQNGIEYILAEHNKCLTRYIMSVNLVGLSLQGMIVLPIKKNEKEKAMIKKANDDRNEKIIAARKGDEEALEKLTLEDIDTYTTVSKKILSEDVLSLVDSYFMPYGVECDQYSILGEIEDYTEEINSYTGEKICILTINYNSMYLKVCINRNDLLGEPQVGRRFKGDILLQGRLNIEM